VTRRLTRTVLFIPLTLIVWTTGAPAQAAPDAPATRPANDDDDDGAAGAAAAPSAGAPATAPSTDAPAGPPDSPATRPSTDAPAGPPADAPASLPPPKVTPPSDATPAPAPTDPNREASSKEAGTAVSGETETVGEVESERVGKSEKKEKSISHYQTGGISVAGGWGFYGVVPYTDGMYCGEYSNDNDSDSGRKSFCTSGRGVAFLEFGAMFGAHPRLDIAIDFRLNMMKRDFVCDDPDNCTGKGLFNNKLGFGLFPGIRGWISKPEDTFKIGAVVQFMWTHEDFSGYRNRPRCLIAADGPQPGDPVCPPGRRVSEPDFVPEENDIKDDDVGARIGLALQVDPHHNIGIFFMPTARLGFLRWFEFGVDLQLGIQARFP
jgi:hypothetical protein